MLLEKSDGGRGSGGALPSLLLRPVPGPRAGVLGMPGRCSQEKGTAEARSGERKRWWNGDGAGEGKENKEADDEDADEAPDEDEEAAGAEVGFGEARRRRRRRLAAAAAGGGGRSGDGEDGLGGIAMACCGLWSVDGVEFGEVKFRVGLCGLLLWLGGSWRRRSRARTGCAACFSVHAGSRGVNCMYLASRSILVELIWHV